MPGGDKKRCHRTSKNVVHGNAAIRNFGMSDYPLHGFSFETPERRQEVAAGHHLWPAFEAWMAGRGYDMPVSMDSEKMRELYECFIEGAYQDFRSMEIPLTSA